MNRLTVGLLLLVLAGCGPAFRSTRVGWRFEVMRPPTITSEAIVQDGPRQLGILGSGSGGLRRDFPAVASEQLIGPPVPVPFTVEERAGLDRTLGMVLQRLQLLEQAPCVKAPAQLSAPKPRKCE